MRGANGCESQRAESAQQHPASIRYTGQEFQDASPGFSMKNAVSPDMTTQKFCSALTASSPPMVFPTGRELPVHGTRPKGALECGGLTPLLRCKGGVKPPHSKGFAAVATQIDFLRSSCDKASFIENRNFRSSRLRLNIRCICGEYSPFKMEVSGERSEWPYSD